MSERPRWIRVASEDRRIGTWVFHLEGERWELERRCGKGEDFGWYLFGPAGAPFGLYLHRRLGPAKRIGEDYARDVPGARAWAVGADAAGSYEPAMG